MPFMKGRGAVRRTMDWLNKGKIILKDDVRLVTFYFNPNKQVFPYHDGLTNFVFWHLPQLKYKNPDVQMVTFKYMTPSPFVQAYLDDGKILIDCDSRGRQDIHDHLLQVLGKTEETLAEEALKARALDNPANFGETYQRQCICTVPGQVPCPAFTPLPRELTGKYRMQMKQENS